MISINVRQISTGFIEVPGKISINIYAQGCKKNCPGCQNQDCLKFDGGEKLDISEIDMICQNYSLANWICWLGGDAVYQPEGLKEFNKEFKSRGYGIALYTGKLFEEIEELITDVDLVIDGEWRGISVQDKGSNQRIWLKDSNKWNLINSWDDLNISINKKIK